MSTATTIHPYYAERAAGIFARAGFDPADSTALAGWAQDADTRARGTHIEHGEQARRCGVVLAADGRLLAETCHYSAPAAASARYVTRVLASDLDVDGVAHAEVGLAMSALHRLTGQVLAHVTYWDACTGSRAAAPRATLYGLPLPAPWGPAA